MTAKQRGVQALVDSCGRGEGGQRHVDVHTENYSPLMSSCLLLMQRSCSFPYFTRCVVFECRAPWHICSLSSFTAQGVVCRASFMRCVNSSSVSCDAPW